MKHASLLLLLCTPCAFAQDWGVSYDYFGVGYGQLDQEVLGQSVNLDGYYLEVSGGGDHVHAFAAHGRQDSDNLAGLGFGLDVEQNLAGVGLHFNVQPGELLIQPAVSVYVQLGYTRATASASSVAGTDEGVQLSTGVRIMPGPRSEIRVGIGRYEGELRMWQSGSVAFTIGDTEATTISLGGRVHVTDAAALQLGFARNQDLEADAISIGMVFDF